MVVALEGVRAGPDIPYPAAVCAVGDWEAVGVVSVEVEEERLEVVACVVGEGELDAGCRCHGGCGGYRGGARIAMRRRVLGW